MKKLLARIFPALIFLAATATFTAVMAALSWCGLWRLYAGLGFGFGWVCTAIGGFGAWPIVLWCVSSLLVVGLFCLFLKLQRSLNVKSALFFSGLFAVGYAVPALPGVHAASCGESWSNDLWLSTTVLFVSSCAFFFAIMEVLKVDPDQISIESAEVQVSDPKADEERESRQARLATVAGIVGTATGAIVGYLDEGWPGSFGAGFIGAIVVAALASAAENALHWFLHGRESQTDSLIGKSWTAWMIASLTGAVVGFAVLHEIYWYASALIGVETLNLTYDINTSVRAGEPRDELLKKLRWNFHRGFVQCTHARPIRWALPTENQFLNSASLDLADLIEGQPPRRTAWISEEKRVALGLAALFHINAKIVNLLSNALVEETSIRLNQASNAIVYSHLRGAWTYQLYEKLADMRSKQQPL